MRFSSLIAITTAVAGFALATTGPSDNGLMDIEAVQKRFEQLGANNDKSIHRRSDDQFINNFLQLLSSNSLLNELVSKVAGSPMIADLKEEVSQAIADNNIDVSTITNALQNSDLVSKFLNSSLHDRDVQPEALQAAKRLYQSGNFDLDGTITTSTKREEEAAPVVLVPLSKKDELYIDNVLQALQNSGVTSSVAKSILNDNSLVNTTEHLVSSTFKDIDFAKLYDTIKNSGVVSDLLNDLLNKSSNQKRFEEEIQSQVAEGLIKRADILGDLVSLDPSSSLPPVLSAPVSSAAPTTTGEGLLGDLLGPKSSAAPTVATTKSTPTTTAAAGGGLGGLLGDLLGGGKSNATTTSPTTTAKPTTAGSGGGLGGLLGDLLGGKGNKTTSPTTTKATSTQTGSFLDGLFDDLLGGHKSNATTTTAHSTSTGGFFDTILDDLFHPKNSTGSTVSTSGGGKGLIAEIFGFLGGILSSFLKSHSSSTGTSTSHISIWGLLEEALDHFLGGGSTPSANKAGSSGGSFIGFLEEIFKSLFSHLNLKGIGSFILHLIEALLSKLFHINLGGSSTGGGLLSGVGSSPLLGPSGKVCCCSIASKAKRDARVQIKKFIKRDLKQRAAIAVQELYINQINK